MSPIYLIAKRFLKTRHNIVGKTTGWVAVLGISIGCFALVISISVLNGFESKVVEKISGIESDIQIITEKDFNLPILDIIKINGVKQCLSVINNNAIIINNEKDHTVVSVKAVEIDSLLDFYSFGKIEIDKFGFNRYNNRVFIGEVLAQKLNLALGDIVRFVNPNSIRIPIGFPIQVSGTIVGVFSSNVLNYDEQMVFISKKMGMSLFSSNQITNNFEIRTYPNASLSDIKKSIVDIVNHGLVYTWMDNHAALVQAMKLEKKGAILVLALIIIVACFNLISNLALIIRKKWRELGILRVIGYTRNAITKIILYQGIILGLAGCISGSIIGGGVVWLQTHVEIFPLPEKIYFMKSLPMEISISEFLCIPILSFFLVLGASFLASRKAAKISLIEALQLEK